MKNFWWHYPAVHGLTRTAIREFTVNFYTPFPQKQPLLDLETPFSSFEKQPLSLVINTSPEMSRWMSHRTGRLDRKEGKNLELIFLIDFVSN